MRATATAPPAAVAVAAAGSKSNAVKFQVATYNLVFWLLVPYHNVHVSVCVCESVCVYGLSDSGVGGCIWLGAHCLHFTRAAFPFFTCILWNFSVYILFMPLPKKKKNIIIKRKETTVAAAVAVAVTTVKSAMAAKLRRRQP